VQLATLKLISICAYLTDGDVKWRPEDHRATKMVKAVKGDPIKGYFSSVVGGNGGNTINRTRTNSLIE
jgi:hypothetical protein